MKPINRAACNREHYQFHWFPNGGCVIHKIDCYTTDNWSTSAWMDAEGKVLNVEISHRFSNRTKDIKRDSPTWTAIRVRAEGIFWREKSLVEREQQRHLELGMPILDLPSNEENDGDR